MSIEGEDVGFGIAPTSYFLPRIRDVETLIFRTAERKKGRDFRESGRRPKELTDELELYVSVPRAASFAVSFRIGSAQLELDLPGPSFSREVIADVFDCLESLNAGNLSELKQQIPDEPYFRNFVGLAEKIAPDGRRVRRVGFTASTDQGERRVALSPKRERTLDISSVIEPIRQDSIERIEGILLEANAKSTKRGIIQVIDDDGKSHQFRIPRGMMSDIVRPMFEERVVVITRRKGRSRLFESIDLVHPD